MTPFDDPVIGLVVGSYQGCSQALHGRPRARERGCGRTEGGERGRAASGGRWMGARSERARGAGGLHARRTPPLGQRPLAVVGVRHPRAACPSFIDWAAERRASSSAMARLPRTRAAEGLLAGQSRDLMLGHRGGAHSCRGNAERRAFFVGIHSDRFGASGSVVAGYDVAACKTVGDRSGGYSVALRHRSEQIESDRRID